MPNTVTTEASILNSMKNLLNMPADYDAFNTDLIIHINSYISVLRSLGVGKNGVKVTDATTTWDDLLGTFAEREAAVGDSSVDLSEVPSWMYTKLKLIFDLENLISVSNPTHNAIHYGDASLLPIAPPERSPGDTKLW